MIMVSACLLGKRTRFDGESRPCGFMVAAHGDCPEAFVAACPECAAGLPQPRPPAEIVGGDGADVLNGHARVVDKLGRDRTAEFVKGARAVLAMAQRRHVTAAILKSHSPSCGVGGVYDGTFSKTLRPGLGVCAALLAANGIAVRSELDVDSAAMALILAENR